MHNFGVTPEKMQELAARMARNSIREEDLQETFVRSGGPPPLPAPYRASRT